MARRWSKDEEVIKKAQLRELYVDRNLTINEISKELSIGKSTVYDRLIRLKIKTIRNKKLKFNNQRNDIFIPSYYSHNLSELVGVVLGDGHLNPTQLTVTLGNKEVKYVLYVANLIQSVFKAKPKIIKTKKDYYVIYIGSSLIVRWFLNMGLKYNKVKHQVNAPSWIFSRNQYMTGFLRGFFDTDGSIYKLRNGTQISLTNRSMPLLASSRFALKQLGFNPSKISKFHVYLTQRKDIVKFFNIIKPANHKHKTRFRLFSSVK